MSRSLFKLITVSVPGIGTLGTLYNPYGVIICRTVEREWNNNQPSISCFPAGDYDLVKVDSAKYGNGRYAISCKTLGVTVNGPSTRTHCLIHAANKPGQLQGCIAPGKIFSSVFFGVVDSRVTLKEVEAQLGMHEKPRLRVVRQNAE